VDMTSPAANNPTAITDLLGIHRLLRQIPRPLSTSSP
jgi:ABC-type molybdate transport system ATPase subunit